MGERAIDDKTLSELEYSRRSPNWDEILFNPKWFLTDAIFYTMGLNPHTGAIKSIGDAVCTFNRNPYGLHRTEFIKRIESVLLSDLVDPATPDKVNTKDFLLWAAINPVFSGLPEPLLKFVVNNSVNDDNESGRRNKQVNKIVSIAKQYYPDLLAIPEGGKQIIKAECLKCKDLFTDSGFIEAWKVARAHNLVCMENVEKYQ